MSANYLGQVLLVQSQVDFARIAAAIERVGFVRDSELESAAPLLKGEPEYATWTCGGVKPFVIYTFNPVVKLRVLDVATVPPVLRMEIAKQLPLLDEAAISRCFDSPEARERLLGLWAAQECERVDLIARVDRLKADSEPMIVEQAEDIGARLRAMNTARESMLIQLRLLSESASQLIEQMRNPAFVATLRPTRAELGELFDETLVNLCADAVDALYRQYPHVNPVDIGTRLEVTACPAGLLRWPNMLSDKFPGAYRDIAGWMQPSAIWLCWTQRKEEHSVAYDGLVWARERWVWLPKIARMLAPGLRVRPPAAAPRR